MTDATDPARRPDEKRRWSLKVNGLGVSGLMLCLAALMGLTGCDMFSEDEVAQAQQPPAWESKYDLPDPLRFPDGTAVTSPEVWRNERRPQILRLFQNHVYGKAPGPPASMRFETIGERSDAFGGKAIRKQVEIRLMNNGQTEDINLLLYLPNDAEKPVPTFLALNFGGNELVHPDSLEDWPVERILERGYGLATARYGDIDPDRKDYFQDGVHPLFYEAGQTEPDSSGWGAIGAWAWGMSRIMDYFERAAPGVDENCAAVMGHSRIGKAALWAGTRDQRFALVVSNNSGAGGASLSRRDYGETVTQLTQRFPHWFADNFDQYGGNESALPVDQHMLISLIAPRPVFVASAAENSWADPKGEYLSAKYATRVYELLGEEGMTKDEWPDVDEPAAEGRIGYHLRPGEHGVKVSDWKRYMDFADRHLSCRQ